MQAAAKLTKLVKTLCARHNIEWWSEQACLRLVMPDVEHYLQVENLGNERISIGLYLELGGKSMPEMELVLWSAFQPEPFDPEVEYPWAPIEYASIYDCWKLYVEMSPNGAIISCFDPAGQSKLAMMANDWSDELESQGWLGENVWRSRCAREFDEQAVWERDLAALFSYEYEETPALDWLTMPEFEGDLWPVHEMTTSSHTTDSFSAVDAYSLIPVDANNGRYEDDKACV